MGASTPVAVAETTKVTDFQRIENRLNETIDILQRASTTALSIKDRLIGGISKEVDVKSDQPESANFVARANVSLNIISSTLEGINTTLDELNAEV